MPGRIRRRLEARSTGREVIRNFLDHLDPLEVMPRLPPIKPRMVTQYAAPSFDYVDSHITPSDNAIYVDGE